MENSLTGQDIGGYKIGPLLGVGGMSTILDADQIVVLQDGQIIQRGTHNTLLEEGGLYEEIYKLQLEEQERVRREAIIAGTIKIPVEDKQSTQEFKALIDRLAGK